MHSHTLELVVMRVLYQVVSEIRGERALRVWLLLVDSLGVREGGAL